MTYIRHAPLSPPGAAQLNLKPSCRFLSNFQTFSFRSARGSASALSRLRLTIRSLASINKRDSFRLTSSDGSRVEFPSTCSTRATLLGSVYLVTRLTQILQFRYSGCIKQPCPQHALVHLFSFPFSYLSFPSAWGSASDFVSIAPNDTFSCEYQQEGYIPVNIARWLACRVSFYLPSEGTIVRWTFVFIFILHPDFPQHLCAPIQTARFTFQVVVVGQVDPVITRRLPFFQTLRT
jgi:hypothetical protein